VMTETFHAYGVSRRGRGLEPISYQVGPLGPDEVQIRIESCGVCHSDLSMIDDAWGRSTYPLVPGHEVIGVVEAAGEGVRGPAPGTRVGLGWISGSCMTCRPCIRGRQDTCEQLERTIVGRHGGFADRIRCHWSWAVPLPDEMEAATAGPLFCGGITVFAPLLAYGVKPTDRVAVIGLGGLGHLAVQFLHKWGCHVTVFTSSASKAEDAFKLGASRVRDSRDPGATGKRAERFDFVLSTVNAALDWQAYLQLLVPGGRLHFVGATTEALQIPPFALVSGSRQISGSSLGSPDTVHTMLDFCVRHGIAPWTENFPMASANEALHRLRAGDVRYRVVLTAPGD